MEILYNILLVLIPSGILSATVYFMISAQFENQERTRALQIRREDRKRFDNQKLQAYERLILLLERISPDALAMRVRGNYKDAESMQRGMIKTIKNEFEHNITQQLYISTEAWKLVVQAKEESIRIVNIAASKTEKDSDAVEYTRVILSLSSQLTPLPTQVAVDGLKSEFRSRYGK